MLNRGQTYDLGQFRACILEMFPYWEQSCLHRMVKANQHIGRRAEPGSILDALQLRELETILNGC